jgi:hypothetical protein
MRILTLTLALFMAGCFAPPGPMERLNQSADDFNAALRFNRLDLAMSHVSKEAQGDFLRRHGTWGRDVRIVDVELQSVRPVTMDSAEVTVGVHWHRMDETTIRSSGITQLWKEGEDGWRVSEEMRVGGSRGLFAKPAKAKRREVERDIATPRPDLGQL